MSARPDDHLGSELSPAMRQRVLSQFQGDWVTHLDLDQMFILIDGVLPFEACLYYQVLPLFLDGNRLNLGMVSPEDTTAVDYVRRIVSYLNYSLLLRPISSEALQGTLSAYLNYIGKRQVNPLQPQDQLSYGHYRNLSRLRAEQKIDPHSRNTLVVDSPDDLDNPEQPIDSAIVTPPPQLPFTPPEPVPPAGEPVAREPAAPVHASGNPVTQASELSSHLLSQQRPSLMKALPVLEVYAPKIGNPIETLTTLPAKDLLQELLARVLLGGIGRLYFENHDRHGRVLWSQNGVLQSVLEKLPASSFTGLLNELKRLAQVPLLPLTQPKQVEMEYLYQQTRLLLRFRFMPSHRGEEATLQVLRGAALKFYQQQQITRLERDALGIAHQLQTKLSEIRDRAQAETGLSAARLEALPALSALLQSIEAQLHALGSQIEED